MPKDPDDSKNDDNSISQVARPLRYSKAELAAQGDKDQIAAPLFERPLNIDIAVEMMMDEISKFGRLQPGLYAELETYFHDLMSLLFKHEVITSSGFLLALQLLHRLALADKECWKKNHRPDSLCVVCMMIGSKYVEDTPFSNATWARGSEHNVTYLESAELQILKLLSFQVHDESIFKDKCEQYAQRESAKARPACTSGSYI